MDDIPKTDEVEQLAQRMRISWLDVPHKYGTDRAWEDCDPAIRRTWRRVAEATLAYLNEVDDG